MNISILASIGCQNLGDELILKNEILLLKNKYSSEITNFKIFSYDSKNPFLKSDNIEYLEYFPIGIKNPRNIFRNLNNFISFIKTIIWSDLIVIGGGGIIYDNENQSVNNPLNQWLFRSNIARLFNKNIIFYGVGIDIKNSGNLGKVKKIFSGTKEIFVRDNNSQNILNKLGINSQIIQDPVFYDKNPVGADFMSAQSIKFTQSTKPYKIENCIKKIESTKFNLKNLKEINFKNKKVGIAFRVGFFNKNGDELKIINHIIKSGGKIILLPHSFNKTDILANDYEFLNKIKSGLDTSIDLKITSSMQETYNYYKEKKLDICLAQRFHSMILSEVYDIPFVGFIYGSKTRELLKE